MVNTLLAIIIATFIASAISLLGILTLLIKDKLLDKILLALVSLSAGTLLGGAFLHLIPESIEYFSSEIVFLYILIGFILFFLMEKILHWHHCHHGKCDKHSIAHINLVGDSVHNFIDGLIIASSFIVDIRLGIITTLVVILHEVPQELGDFGVLVYSGFTKTKALFLNFITAITAVLGGIIGYFLSSYTEMAIAFFLPFAAGGFIYIAASDLVPEIKKEMELKKYIVNFILFLIGIVLMYGLLFIE
ncbi:MAG: ZIP family metal transporter [Nanoarchaeota archaeon]|nr:ZIP family metal transporter [Nanoarchaeota archaeon]|tara:strand:+ start:609 stop:1349 length:741 start_codon:yes stop_codon:yes gene_type:complete